MTPEEATRTLNLKNHRGFGSWHHRDDFLMPTTDAFIKLTIDEAIAIAKKYTDHQSIRNSGKRFKASSKD